MTTKSDERLLGLIAQTLGNRNMPGDDTGATRRDMDVQPLDVHQGRNAAHMFSNSQNIKIRDTTINNIGRDITIINNYIYHQPDPFPSRSSQWSHLFTVTVIRACTRF
ncbi:hypothetical protein M413DRAFT_391163 [Hebeloma cylindrosporum]|uniref:Uncharacterized protein n=1 Tax=Hebeloma cylindrosporum TaxID=76867 RepID=A0A0C2X9Z8_HEBCY|nr:hypothetical protein M413DRAFT_391163 [Hebeloma cylindrosporum h7]